MYIEIGILEKKLNINIVILLIIIHKSLTCFEEPILLLHKPHYKLNPRIPYMIAISYNTLSFNIHVNIFLY